MNDATLAKLADIAATPVNRRSLLKRVGLLGATLPLGGALLSACGTSDGLAALDASSPAAGGAIAMGESAAAPVEITITARDLSFTPKDVTVTINQPVRLTFINAGAVEHDWDVHELPVSSFAVIAKPDNFSQRLTDLLKQTTDQGFAYAGAGPGQQMTIEFAPAKAGAFEMSCMVPGHREAGMKGTFTVTDPAASADTGDSAAATPAEGMTGMPAGTPSAGTPYVADRLPRPAVAAPVGARGPQLITQELEIIEQIGYLDEGVAYEFWTFGGTIPGPMLRARVGDTVELTLKNAANSKMPHSIDLHAATGLGGGAKLTQIAPGQSATFRWKALHPGVFVYHCATPPIPQHITNGMYGLVVIEPEGGLPPVDREFYVMQGDFYLQGARGDQGLRAFSMDKLYDERPDYIVFNGAVGALTDDRALQATAGDTIRLFFGVGGPNVTSSLHVIGAIFDRVAQEGAAEWSTHVQTTLVPAGGATIVEFSVPVPGDYTIVDHSLGRLLKGAAGMLRVEGDPAPEIIEQVEPPH